jgi:hypothetical protein
VEGSARVVDERADVHSFEVACSFVMGGKVRLQVKLEWLTAEDIIWELETRTRRRRTPGPEKAPA